MELNNKKGKSLFNTAQVITLLILTSVFSMCMGMIIANNNTELENNTYDDYIKEFVNNYNNIKENYYEDIDDEESMKVAIEAIINSLDDYTTVIDDNLSNSLSTTLQGTYEGIGVEIYNDKDNNIIVGSVLDDSPALKAGVQANDVIIKLNDTEVSGVTTTEFVSMVKQIGSAEFNITVKRNDSEITLNLVRDKVVISSVTSDIFNINNKKIGYIYVSIFAANTDVQFKNALEQLEEENIDSLIVDLRGNSGGHLSAVENMLDYFLDTTHVIYQIQTKTETTKHYASSDDKRTYPVAVIVDNGSASASEIFAATMKEEYNATIIGSTTYGKGTVQELQDSQDGTVQYKITTKKWLTPNGTWINGVGVTPTIEVELTTEDILNGNDTQLEKAKEILSKEY